jgi:senataxin
LHQQHQSERRQQQGLQGRHKQLLLTARVSLKGSGGSAARQLLQQQLTPGTSWQAVRLMSLTPHLRQLQALVAAQRLPPLLLAELLSPGTTTASRGSGSGGAEQQQQLATVHPSLPTPMLRQLQQHYNSSQQAAIAAAAAGYQPASCAATAGAAQGALAAALASSNRGQRHVTLVQGPPGTGKTSAILGMLSVFLSANAPKGVGNGKAGSNGKPPASSKQQVPPAAVTAAAGRPAAVINPTVRVLLCAQSNAAVDELCTRLASRGVVGR